MAQKKTPPKQKKRLAPKVDSIEKLAALMTAGFSTVRENMNERFALVDKQFVSIDKRFAKIEHLVEQVAGALTDDIAAVRSEMNTEAGEVRRRLKEIDDGVIGANTKIAGVHNRIDEELDRRKQIEVRVSNVERALSSRR